MLLETFRGLEDSHYTKIFMIFLFNIKNYFYSSDKVDWGWKGGGGCFIRKIVGMTLF